MSDRQNKREQFTAKKSQNKAIIAIAAIVLIVGLGVAGMTLLGASSAGYQKVAASGGMVSIPLEKVSDGQAHFFVYQGGNQPISFFVLKSHDGVVRAAFDSCDVCYKDRKGYRQEADFMVCNNCDQKFRSDRINEVSGGCNPAPLERVVRDGQLLIAEADLQAGAWYFSTTN